VSGRDDRKLVVRDRSSYYMRDGQFVLAIGGVLLVLQLLVYVVGWTDQVLLFPFGLMAAAAFLIGGGILLIGTNARGCGLCGEGLQPDRYIAVTEGAVPAVADALRGGDAAAIMAAVVADPYEVGDKWASLKIEYCPKCGQVALVHLEEQHAFTPPSWRPPHTFTGPAVASLLAVSEVEISS
jgi:hypothetical protein